MMGAEMRVLLEFGADNFDFLFKFRHPKRIEREAFKARQVDALEVTGELRKRRWPSKAPVAFEIVGRPRSRRSERLGLGRIVFCVEEEN